MSASNGDTCYFEGKLDDAARFYATAMKHAPSMDPNNNGGDNDNGELYVVNFFFKSFHATGLSIPPENIRKPLVL